MEMQIFALTESAFEAEVYASHNLLMKLLYYVPTDLHRYVGYVVRQKFHDPLTKIFWSSFASFFITI